MGRGVGGTGPSPRSATVTIYLYSKITLQSKLWTSKPTTIRLRKIRSLDKSKTSCPCVLYPHISRRARSESGVKPVFCLAIFACHEVTAAIVRAIHPDLQTYKFNKGYLGYIVKPNRAQNFRLSNLRQKSTINNSVFQFTNVTYLSKMWVGAHSFRFWIGDNHFDTRQYLIGKKVLEYDLKRSS